MQDSAAWSLQGPSLLTMNRSVDNVVHDRYKLVIV